VQVMTDRQSVAANATVANAVSGKVHEFITRPSKVRLYGCASAVGLNMTFIVGNVTVMQDQEVNAQNRMPIVPDDWIVDAGAKPGDRVVLSYRNSTGGAITAFSRVEVIPVA
jgi:selenophosphate synthetase-related protein